MAFDQGAYKKAVLDPARRAGNIPPPDLTVRYALTPSELHVDTAFDARVAEVSGYWRTLNAGNNKLYKKLVQALLAGHLDLEQRGTLTAAAFRKQRDEAVAAARTRLVQRATSIANSLPCITAATLERLVEDGGGLLEGREVREVLRKNGVTVIDPPWQIPVGPPLPIARNLPDQLSVLGLRLSIELVLGVEGLRAGFRVKGGFRTQGDQTIGPSTLDEVRKDTATRPHDERKTASDNVIALLTKAIAAPGKLEELLTWELAGLLRPDVAAGMPVRAVADNATGIGLDPGESLELAVTLSAAAAPALTAAAEPDDTELVEELLRAGALREAAELAGALPPEAVSAATRTRLAAAVKEVADLLVDADRAHAAADPEEEARLLGRALVKQADDDVRARLDRIAPPPPTQLRAMADGDRIALHWRHSEARTGTVRYRVIRSAGGAAASARAREVVAETDADSAVDAQPPVGTPHHYTVFASRGGAAWSTGAATGPVAILPEVRALELDATARTVSGSWRVLPDVVDVEVLRADPTRGGPDTRIALRAGSLEGFVDNTVTTGDRYEYRVRAVYRGPAGDRLTTDGVVAAIRPQGEPVAVTDLSAGLVPSSVPPVIEVRWSSPASGTPDLRIASVAPEWAPGTVLALATANSYGRPQSGPVGHDSSGRATMRLPVRDGTTFLTVFTVGARNAVVGNTVRFAVANPVTDLRATRRGSRVRLGWIWPDGATSVRITWSGDTAEGQVDLSLREYNDNGGFTVDAGTGALEVAVMTLARDAAGPVLSTATARTVPGRPPQVWWRISRRGWSREVVLTLTSDRPCEVPSVLVVRGRGGHRPDDPDRGDAVAEIPRSRVSPEAPLEHPLGRERRTGPVGALGSFIKGDHTDLIFGPAQP